MSTRHKTLLIVLATVVGIAVAGYAMAPAIVAAMASRSLGDVVEVRELEIQSVSWEEIDVAIIRVNNNEMRLDAQQVTVRYAWWPFRITAIEIAVARVVIASLARDTEAGAVAPVPPPFPVAVDDLTVQAATPWGRLSARASLTAGRGAADGLQADLNGRDFSARLRNPAGNQYVLDLYDARNTALISLQADLDDGFPVTFEGQVNPQATSDWLRTSQLLPPGDVKSALAPFEIQGHSLRFSGEAQENTVFTARLRGTVAAGDRREPGERLFQSVSLQSPSQYTIAHSDGVWSGSGEAAVRLALDSDTTLQGRDPTWRWDQDALTLSLSETTWKELGLQADTTTVTTPELTVAGSAGGIRFIGARTDWWPRALAHYDIEGSWSWRDSALEARGKGAGPGLPDLSWVFETEGDRGTVEINSQYPVAGLTPSLEVYTRVLARELKIGQGELKARYRHEWQADGERTDLSLHAGPVDADLDEMEIRGLVIRVSGEGDAPDRLDAAISAPTLELGGGAVARDVQIEARLSPPKIHIDTARARLLGGSVSIRPASLDLNDRELVLNADIADLSLGQVMGLFELESTELTGAVSGPVRLIYRMGKGIEVNEGHLHSTQPGVLRFRIDPESGMARQYDNIALRALENLEYRELSAGLLYKPDGEYRITARIVGSNPDVLDGHPIALNPTIQGRLPALFRAFLITGDFSRAIIEMLEKERALSSPGETSTFEGD